MITEPMACIWRGDSSAVRFPSVQSPSTGHGDVLEAESSQAGFGTEEAPKKAGVQVFKI